MQHLDEGTIHAWLDGELSPAERAEVESHVAECAQCASAVAEARGFVAGASRILTALDSVPGGVIPASASESRAARPAAPRRFVASRAWMAVAAVLVLSTVTVIATRPNEDTAQLQVAAAARDQKSLPASVTPSQDTSSTATAGAARRAAHSDTVRAVAPRTAASPSAAPAAAQAAGNAVSPNAPTTMQSRAAAPAEEQQPVDQTERLKSRLEAERKSTLVRPSNGEPGVRADVAPPALAAPQASASQTSDKPAMPQTDSAIGKNLGEKHELDASVYDSLRGRGRVTGTDESPVIVSRSTSTESGDTVVTTTYAVSGGTVTLIERSPAQDALQRQKPSASFNDQVMAKARDDTHVNSITWSDSTGRMRTLRGAVPSEELERIRTTLFGATP